MSQHFCLFPSFCTAVDYHPWHIAIKPIRHVNFTSFQRVRSRDDITFGRMDDNIDDDDEEYKARLSGQSRILPSLACDSCWNFPPIWASRCAPKMMKHFKPQNFMMYPDRLPDKDTLFSTDCEQQQQYQKFAISKNYQLRFFLPTGVKND